MGLSFPGQPFRGFEGAEFQWQNDLKLCHEILRPYGKTQNRERSAQPTQYR